MGRLIYLNEDEGVRGEGEMEGTAGEGSAFGRGGGGFAIELLDLGGGGVGGLAHAGPLREDVPVGLVYALDANGGVRGYAGEVEGQLAGGAGLVGVDEVPGSDAQGAVGVSGDDDVLRGICEALISELVQQAVVVVAGLVDAVEGAEAEAAVEGAITGAALFKDVGEGPEGEHVDVAVALADGAGEGGADVDGIAGLHHAGDVPFGPEEG